MLEFKEVNVQINNNVDAFRHAHWNCLMALHLSVGAKYAKMFSDAHESDVPSIYALEKEMDLFNNAVGYKHSYEDYPGGYDSDDYPGKGIPSSIDIKVLSDYAKEIIWKELESGNLRCLHPINYDDPDFWDRTEYPDGDNGYKYEIKGTHGITSETKLIPTKVTLSKE